MPLAEASLCKSVVSSPSSICRPLCVYIKIIGASTVQWNTVAEIMALKDPFSRCVRCYLRISAQRLKKRGVEISYHGCGIQQHDDAVPEQDICPCEAKIWYLTARNEESYQRYVKKQQPLGSCVWLFWYLKSSRESQATH